MKRRGANCKEIVLFETKEVSVFISLKKKLINSLRLSNIMNCSFSKLDSLQKISVLIAIEILLGKRFLCIDSWLDLLSFNEFAFLYKALQSLAVDVSLGFVLTTSCFSDSRLSMVNNMIFLCRGNIIYKGSFNECVQYFRRNKNYLIPEVKLGKSYLGGRVIYNGQKLIYGGEINTIQNVDFTDPSPDAELLKEIVKINFSSVSSLLFTLNRNQELASRWLKIRDQPEINYFNPLPSYSMLKMACFGKLVGINFKAIYRTLSISTLFYFLQESTFFILSLLLFLKITHSPLAFLFPYKIKVSYDAYLKNPNNYSFQRISFDISVVLLLFHFFISPSSVLERFPRVFKREFVMSMHNFWTVFSIDFLTNLPLFIFRFSIILFGLIYFLNLHPQKCIFMFFAHLLIFLLFIFLNEFFVCFRIDVDNYFLKRCLFNEKIFLLLSFTVKYVKNAHLREVFLAPVFMVDDIILGKGGNAVFMHPLSIIAMIIVLGMIINFMIYRKFYVQVRYRKPKLFI
ncbi:hypothetical protein NUSPORA_01507 [Nucleospora cyclopteri]